MFNELHWNSKYVTNNGMVAIYRYYLYKLPYITMFCTVLYIKYKEKLKRRRILFEFFSVYFASLHSALFSSNLSVM